LVALRIYGVVIGIAVGGLGFACRIIGEDKVIQHGHIWIGPGFSFDVEVLEVLFRRVVLGMELGQVVLGGDPARANVGIHPHRQALAVNGDGVP